MSLMAWTWVTACFFDDFKLAENARVAAIQFAKRRNPDWKFGIRKMNNGWRIFRMV